MINVVQSKYSVSVEPSHISSIPFHCLDRIYQDKDGDEMRQKDLHEWVGGVDELLKVITGQGAQGIAETRVFEICWKSIQHIIRKELQRTVPSRDDTSSAYITLRRCWRTFLSTPFSHKGFNCSNDALAGLTSLDSMVGRHLILAEATSS